MARAIFFVEAVGGIITGIVLCANDEALSGLITILCSIPVAWCSACLLYGFGELIDKVCDIERHVRKEDSTPTEKTPVHKEILMSEKHTEPKLKKPPYRCAQCDHAGPYIGACPKCGSFKTKRE